MAERGARHAYHPGGGDGGEGDLPVACVVLGQQVCGGSTIHPIEPRGGANQTGHGWLVGNRAANRRNQEHNLGRKGNGRGARTLGLLADVGEEAGATHGGGRGPG